METLDLISWFISFFIYALAIGLLIGIYKPWISLWWFDRQNRKLVFKYYGIPLVVFILIKQLLNLSFIE